MRIGFRRSRSRSSRAAAGDDGRALGLYEAAFLAGGAHRVADCALIVLAGRELVTVKGARVRAVRVRAVGGQPPLRPVEHVAFEFCRRSRTVAATHTAVRRSPEAEEIARRLAGQGLVTASRHRTTRAGKRRLRSAERTGTLPAYVFAGPAALPRGRVRRDTTDAQPIPSALVRALRRMGKALDHDFEHDYDYDSGTGTGTDSASDCGSSSTSDSGSGGGFSCGGGGGGGD
ncbi:TIGR04222 domain-containing membrane protein [Streptomyces sp. NPDC002643]